MERTGPFIGDARTWREPTETAKEREQIKEGKGIENKTDSRDHGE